MSTAILLIGESGCGKSTSFRNLNPEETFFINILDKPLPFRGYKKSYTKLSPDGLEGNYYESDDPDKIIRIIKLINSKRPEIKNLIIDDFGFTLTNTYMRRSREHGFTKFADIGRQVWEVINSLRSQRDDLNCVVTMHTEIDNSGRYKPKTIGKMTDQYNLIEGSFTYVLHALIVEQEYLFLTNNDGSHMAKTPMACFVEMYVPNDMNEVLTAINNYNNGN